MHSVLVSTMKTNNEIFQGLDDALLKQIEINSTIKTYVPGAVLFNEGDYVKYFPVVLSGSIKITRESEDGKEIYLYTIRPGESCLMSFQGVLNHENSKVRAVVEEPSDLLLIPSDIAARWVDEYPSWNRFVIHLYSKRLEELLDMVNAIAFQKMDQRIWDSLTRRYKEDGKKDIQVTHQQLADELGTHREVVSRLLKQLEKEKKVTLSRNKITILTPM